MQHVRVILDFPGQDRNRERLVAETPVRVISAHHPDDVRPALRDAELAARAGAWVMGFVAYEAAPAFDPALRTNASAARHGDGLVSDGEFRPLGELQSGGGVPDGGTLSDEEAVPLLWFGVFDRPAFSPAPAFPHAHAHARTLAALEWTPDIDARAGYEDAIAVIRDAIAAGDVYQVNHTLRFRASCNVAPADLYEALAAGRHGAYCALIETPDWAIVSASPELFVDMRDGAVTTRPMKGTARRGRWLEEDASARERLAQSPKDRAENLMIVDLLRNDFGRIARFGTVAVHDMFAIETYSTVHQMTSTITARLRDDVTIDDIFAAAFPCGSVTGAPKVAAMQHIAALEHSPRGPYCGAIGILRPDGTATFNVAIRTVVIDRHTGTATYGAGGGITWDSAADAEYDEATAKAALLNDTTPEFDLLETMRLENGVISRIDMHLARLAASAHYWGFADDAAARAAAALAELCAMPPAGTWRVRMTVARDGHVAIARTTLDDDPPRAVRADDREAAGRRADASADATRTAEAFDRAIVVARAAVNTRDPLLYHKTTARALYDRHRAAHPAAFDVLLCNEHDCITEFTIGNVVCEIDGELVTPPRCAGLLAGTFREQLLRDCVIRERSLPIAALADVTRMWLINSVREWTPISSWSEA